MTFPRIEPGSHGWESYTSLKKKEQRVRKKRKRAKGEVAAEEQAVGASGDPGDQKSVPHRVCCQGDASMCESVPGPGRGGDETRGCSQAQQRGEFGRVSRVRSAICSLQNAHQGHEVDQGSRWTPSQLPFFQEDWSPLFPEPLGKAAQEIQTRRPENGIGGGAAGSQTRCPVAAD